MKRLWWVFVPFSLVALGCASSVPVECPQGYGLTADGADCEIVPGEDPGPDDGSDGGTEDTSDGGTITPLKTCDEDCDDGNECTNDGCDDGTCASVPAEDGTACTFEEGAGVCEAGTCVRDCEIEDCRVVYPCTEQGLRDAVEDGGEIVIGCNGPTTVLLNDGALNMFKDVSIDGLGLLTLDAQGISRVFAANDEITAELIGIDITGGSAATDEEHSGGGIHTSGYTNVTVKNCRVYGNTARDHGGGIKAAGKLTLESSAVYANTAGGGGGGIAAWRETRVINSLIADNEATTKGGGIYGTGEKAVVTIEDSVMERNRATESGGGIWSSGATILDGAIIQDNVCGDAGGGVRAYALGETRTGTLTTRNGTVFANNTAAIGGAISTYELDPEVVTISDTEFIGNSAVGSSGGAIFSDKSPMEINDSFFEGNRAVNAAGAVYTKSMEAVFRRSTFSDHEARVGGAFRIRGNATQRIDALFENCTISGSHATERGGAFFNGDSTTLLLHTSVADSTAVGAGSGIHLTNAALRAQHSVVAGGCYADPDSALVSLGYNAVLTPTAEQCVFTPLEGMATDLGLTAEQMGLAQLADNGGGTLTHMPMEGSALIDAIPPESCLPDLLRDQRDEPRDGTSPCDIGAVEVQQGE